MNLADCLALHARRRPDHPVVLSAGREISYAQFHSRVERLAGEFSARGIARGDIVALAPPETAAYLASVYALARLGAIVMPIDPDLAPQERQELAHEFNVAALVCHGGEMTIPKVTRILVDFNSPVGSGGVAADVPLPDSTNFPFELSFSSGTTGKPKAFVVTHGQQQSRYRLFRELGLGADDRYLVVTSLRFDMGLRLAMVVVNQGGTLVLNQHLDSVERLVAVCAQYTITATYIMPAHLRQLVALGDDRTPLLPSMRFLLVGGSQLWAKDRADTRASVTPNFYEVYGANEVSTVVVSTPDDQARFPNSLGRTSGDAELEIILPDDTPAPPDSVGQVRFRHPGMVAGYLNTIEANARTFRDGWFYSGDLAKQNKLGYIFFRGRADDVINVDGTKFYPADTEAALLRHPAVAEAAVVSAPWHQGRNVVLGFVVLRAPATTDELLAFCREKIARYKVPHQISILESIPRTGSGKIKKRLLAGSFSAPDSAILAIRTPFETS